MEINKVVFGSDTIMDISDTTASEGDVLATKYFYTAAGVRTAGMAQALTIDSALSTTSENPVQNKVITQKVGLDSLNTVAQDLSGAVNEILGAIPSTAADVGALPNTTVIPSAGTITPKNLGNAAAGTSTYFARADHIHNTQLIEATYGSTTASEIVTNFSFMNNYIAIYCIHNNIYHWLTSYSFGGGSFPYMAKFTGISNNTLSILTVNESTWSASSYVLPSASDATPQALGTASAGSSSYFSRSDHVHAMPSALDVGIFMGTATPTTGDIAPGQIYLKYS